MTSTAKATIVVSCILGTVYLIANGKDGRGWLVLIALLAV
jgi:hypothetical protein